MLETINTWNDYRTKVREFDAVLEHGKAVAAALSGAAATTPQASYGGQIFLKLLGHGVALRRLAPDPGQPMPRELVELPSMSALAHGVIEAHDAFEYIAGHAVSDDERGFRIRLWELHDATRRLRILAGAGSAPPGADDIRADARRLQAALEAHPLLASLAPELQAELRKRFSRGEPPAFHLSQRQRCELSGVNADWHKAVTLQLSQHVHTLPFSVQQLSQLPASAPQALGLLALPLVFALPFLARTTLAVDRLIPSRAPAPPSRTARTMALWSAIAGQGMKGIG